MEFIKASRFGHQPRHLAAILRKISSKVFKHKILGKLLDPFKTRRLRDDLRFEAMKIQETNSRQVKSNQLNGRPSFGKGTQW